MVKGGHRASGHLVLNPPGGFFSCCLALIKYSLPLSLSCLARGIVRCEAGGQNKPPPPLASATQSRKPSADFLRVTTPGLKRAGTK